MLVAGCGVAAMFFRAGRTKVEGLLTITDSTFERFRTDRAVPFMNPRACGACRDLLGAPLSGLVSAWAADSPGVPPPFGMTSVLEVLVYPDTWSTPLSWASLLLPLIAVGAGPLSLDRFVEIKPTSRQS
jgi:putative oxidoreductase